MAKLNGVNGHHVNGHGANGEADVSAPAKQSLISLFPIEGKAKRAAKIVAARDKFMLAQQLLDQADDYAARAARAEDAAARASLEAVANETLTDAIKLRHEAQAILSQF